MTTKHSPHNQATVPVLDSDGEPLAPTRPSRARRWLETGKARKAWLSGHFAVQLIELANNNTPDVALNIDPGYKTTGLAVVIAHPDGTVQVVQGYELRHRTKAIVMRMLSRRSYRCIRRGRLWRRPARFNNRTRSEDWLPPSMLSCLSGIITTIARLRRLFPIRRINIETCKFDPRLMHDPFVFGKGYQIPERGRLQIREYVLQRDQRTCQYCDATGVTMEVDHVVPKSAHGTYRIDNLITACRRCNQKKDNRDLSNFLAHDPARAERVRRQLKRPLAAPTHMNRLMALLRERLHDTGLPVEEHDAVSTAITRIVLNVPKTHVNDAACLSEPERIINLPETITIINHVGHGKRQMLSTPSRYGTPRYQAGAAGRNSPYRAYCRIPLSQQGYTTMPGHKRRARRVHGITSGDLIRYEHSKDGVCQGYAILVNGNTRVQVPGSRSVKVERATLLARHNGYRHHGEANLRLTRAN